MTHILANENVQKLFETMDLDLEMPENYFSITDYELIDGKIVINKIEAFDNKGNFIRLADINKLFNHINRYPITFR
jgi:hypothetical protein